MSLRYSDTLAEVEIGKFLDKYFYSELTNNDCSFNRVHDKSLQLKGIDVICEQKNGRIFYLDEKAQVHYINKNLPTFAFEVDSIQRGHLTQGWFLNPRYETTHYVLTWITATKDYDKTNILTFDNIQSLKVITVSRGKLLKHLNSIISLENIKKKSCYLRENNCFGKGEKIGSIGHWYYTNHLDERPINIVLYKHFLIDICNGHYTIDKDSFKALKIKR